MNRVISWFATNHVAANLVMALAILAGLVSIVRIPFKLVPDMDVPIVTVSVPYLGAAPAEVESGVCARLEEQLEGIEGIRELRSVAAEGRCSIEVEFFYDVDRLRALGEVDSRVNAIHTLPIETEKPIVELAQVTDLVLEVAVTGPEDERALKELGRRVRDDIRRLPGVTEAWVLNERPYEIAVEVSEASLSRYRLSFDDIASALRKRSLDLPGGAVKTEQGELLLRSSGQAYWGDELKNLPVTSRADGTRVLLKDVAEVVDGFAETVQGLRFDGRPAALVRVARVGNQDAGQISETVKRYVAEAPSYLPAGTELAIWRDQSARLAIRLATLLDSGLQGLLLVLILLALFLRPHVALWVGAGIPIAFLGAIFLIYAFGFSMDATSLMGFILAIGMLVDDAVVVGESVYVSHRQGAGQLAGAIEGAQRVLLPVTFGVLTTVVAFLPLLFGEGRIGVIFGVMASTVICCVIASLIECMTVLPAHLGHRSTRLPLGEFGLILLAIVIVASLALAPSLRVGAALAVAAGALLWALHMTGWLNKLGARFTRGQVRFESALAWFVANPFRRLAERALRNRALALAAGFVVLVLAAATVYSGHVPYSFTMPTKGDSIVARLTMPLGSSETATAAVVDRLASTAWEVRAQVTAEHEQPVVEHIVETIGAHPAAGIRLGFGRDRAAAHLGGVTMQLTPSEGRGITTNEVAARWRDINGPVPSDVRLVFLTDRVAQMPGIDIRLTGSDPASLGTAVAAVRRELATYPGVYQIADTFRIGKEELQLAVTPAGEALGLTLAEVGRQVRQAFYGEEVQRVQRGRDDVRIMLRYPAADRRSLASLDSLRIRTSAGGEVPFRTVADVTHGRGLADIERVDGGRTVNVTAETDRTVTTPDAVLRQLDRGFLAGLVAAYPGISYSLESDNEQAETIASIGPVLILAIAVIYALLAIPLKSYTQPLMIMAVIPFAFVGAVFGHALMQPFGLVLGISMTSIFGFVAACGVVVNATLVLIHGVNRYRSAGETMHDALLEAAVSRFRPILITTVTTMAGLTPLMLTRSVQAQPLVPMAISLGFGVLASSAAALLVVPAFWLALHDLSGGARRVAAAVGGLLGGAPRLARWMARYPYVQESLRAQDFTDLQLPADLDLDPQTERIARRGLVRLYYEREFDATEMAEQFNAIATRAATSDDLAAEARSWAEQKTFQLGTHMANAAIEPLDAARPLTDILTTCFAALMTAAKRDCADELGALPNARVALVALGAAGRREFETGASMEVMVVYDNDPLPSTAPLTAAEWHERLVQRFLRLVGEVSPEGFLFGKVAAYPLRLDDGVANAWSMQDFHARFERPAPADLRSLTSARVVGGDGSLVADFDAVRRSVFARQHDLAAVATELARIREAYPPARDVGEMWDVVRPRGGLGDLELAVEFLHLAGARLDDGVAGLADTFETAGRQNQLDAALAGELARSIVLLQNLSGFLRMTSVGQFDPKSTTPEQRRVIAELAGTADLDALPDMIADLAERNATHLDGLFAKAIATPP